MASSDDAIWEMHGLLHELSGSIKSHKDRLDVIESELRKIQAGVGEVSALRQAASNADSQRKTIFEKLDELENLVSGMKATLSAPVSAMVEGPIDRLAEFMTTKNLLIVLAFLGIIFGLWSLDDLRTFIPVPPTP